MPRYGPPHPRSPHPHRRGGAVGDPLAGPCAAVLLALVASAALAVAAVCGPPAAAGEAAAAAEPPRVVVLGFDGADADLTRRWMDAGELPHLARLRDEGTFAPLLPTLPSQTPVSWSTFSTGLNPGRHSIFDFLRRDPATYRPDFASLEEGTEPYLFGERNGAVLGAGAAALVLLLAFPALKLGRVRTGLALAVALVAAALLGGAVGWGAHALLPREQPVATSLQQGATFWELLGDAGVRVRVMRVPVTYPPEPFHGGELLSGLGVPDVSLRIGRPYYLTSDPFFEPQGGGETTVEVVELPAAEGRMEVEIPGPPNRLFPEGEPVISVPLALTVAADRSRLTVEVPGEELELEVGEWSDWVPIPFRFNPLVAIHGMGRFRLMSLEPEVRLYLSPIQFDPQRLPSYLDVTSPRRFVDRLTGRFGRFKTQGWALDTWSITEGTIGEEVFLEDVEATVAKGEEMLLGMLADADEWDVLVHYFEFTDRVQHVMFRHFDPQHPAHSEEGAERWGDAVPGVYRRMDAIVGRVMERLPEGAELMVVSDHGFSSWRRTVNYNAWLAREGYLVLEGERADRANLDELLGGGEFFQGVDWSRTRAYAMGLGNVYLNLAGREAEGIVQPGAEYRELRAEIARRLEALVDPQTGEHPVERVLSRDEAYGEYDPRLIPDLFPSNARGYRVGWKDSLGIVARRVLETNDEVWSGDHCSVYPPRVRGILFSSRRFAATDPYMADVPATLLDLYGVAPPEALDGESLLAAR